MDSMSSKEWRDICMDLQDYHAVFYKMWEIGKPYFSTETKTAAVCFDEKGSCINFIFNPDFWKKCSKYKKMFVICHESLHILLNHGYRFKDSEYQKLSNYAMDVAINHALINRFGFDRNSIEDQEKYCWVDTVFPDQKYQGFPIPDDESAEFYYSLLLKKDNQKQNKQPQNSQKKGDGEKPKGDQNDPMEGSGGEPQTLDSHDFLNESKDSSKINKILNSSLSNEEKKDFSKRIKKNQKNHINYKAGTGEGGIVFNIENEESKVKRKWETVITNWTKKRLKEAETNKEQWARKHRRHQFLNDSLFLPSDMEIDDIVSEKDKIEVYFFLDTSGSCIDYKDRFFNAAKTLNPKKFNINLLCFDVRVYPTTLESQRVYGGGGTNFYIIEEYIQRTKTSKAYPDSVWILTDGHGTNVLPEIPNRWHWFITDGGSDRFIHEDSKKYKLKDFS